MQLYFIFRFMKEAKNTNGWFFFQNLNLLINDVNYYLLNFPFSFMVASRVNFYFLFFFLLKHYAID
jgi:hypothetical protein